MPMVQQEPDPRRHAEILTRALVRASQSLNLPQRSVAVMLGVSEASISRLAHGDRTIDPNRKEGELAILFLRLYRSLDALLGGDETKARHWMQSQNHHLGGVPGRLVESVTGLIHVTEYLDAMRGKS